MADDEDDPIGVEEEEDEETWEVEECVTLIGRNTMGATVEVRAYPVSGLMQVTIGGEVATLHTARVVELIDRANELRREQQDG